jgi:hypothetical protein
LFVNEVHANERFFAFITVEDMAHISDYLQLGTFASGTGDLVVDACTEILGTPIVVISSAKEMDVSIHIPEKRQLTSTPLFLAYMVNGPGHYDGTKSYNGENDQEYGPEEGNI